MKTYLKILFLLVAVDGMWILVVANSFYLTHLGYLMGGEVKYWAFVIFYLIYAMAIKVLVVDTSKNPMQVAKKGALLGLAAYAAYDLTNQTVIRDWPLIVTILDMTWGVLLTAIVSWTGKKLL